MVASIVSGRIDIARTDVEALHIGSTEPRRGPEAAEVTLIVSLTGVEVAGERRREGRLEGCYLAWGTTTV